MTEKRIEAFSQKIRNGIYLHRLTKQHHWKISSSYAFASHSITTLKWLTASIFGLALFGMSKPNTIASQPANMTSHVVIPDQSFSLDNTQSKTDPDTQDAPVNLPSKTLALDALNPTQQKAAKWIASTYKVAPEAVAVMVKEAWVLGKKKGIDPTMLLAIVAVESRFNPLAQSPVGAQGLMQVMTRVHSDKYDFFGGIHKAFDPIVNMHVGTKILAEYVRKTKSIEGALKYYVGAALHPHDGGYANKVFERYEMLNRVTGITPSHRRLNKPVTLALPRTPEPTKDPSNSALELPNGVQQKSGEPNNQTDTHIDPLNQNKEVPLALADKSSLYDAATDPRPQLLQ